MLCVIGIPILILLIFVVVVNFMQRKTAKFLPEILKTWDFLPLPLHSLEPYDRIITGTVMFDCKSLGFKVKLVERRNFVWTHL